MEFFKKCIIADSHDDRVGFVICSAPFSQQQGGKRKAKVIIGYVAS